MCPMCLYVSKKNFNLSAEKGMLDHVIFYLLLSCKLKLDILLVQSS
jgi:hypothetical protein